jgi:hypothetical protein
MSDMGMYRCLSDQTLADIGKQLGQGHLVSLNFETTRYALKPTIVKRQNVMLKITPDFGL